LIAFTAGGSPTVAAAELGMGANLGIGSDVRPEPVSHLALNATPEVTS
jgi:hypothetical protein